MDQLLPGDSSLLCVVPAENTTTKNKQKCDRRSAVAALMCRSTLDETLGDDLHVNLQQRNLSRKRGKTLALACGCSAQSGCWFSQTPDTTVCSVALQLEITLQSEN